MNKAVYLLTLIILASCNNLKKDTIPATEKVTVEYRRKIKLSNLIQPDYSYLPLQTANTPLVGEISKIIKTDTSYYIYDENFLKKVILFDSNGQYRMDIGKRGEAEGEYSEPKDFVITQKAVEIFDKNKFAILSFEHSGKFISEKKVPFSVHEMQIFTDNTKILYVPEDGPSFQAKDVLYIVEEDYQKVKTSFFPYESGNDDVPLPGFLSKFKENVTYCRTMLGEFYTINKDLELNARFVVDYGKHSWSIEKEELSKDQEITESLFYRGGIMSLAHRLNETEDFLVFYTFMLDPESTRKRLEPMEDQWLCVYHKKSKKIIAIKEVENDIDGGLFSFPVATFKNQFIGVLSAERILEWTFNPQNKIDQHTIERHKAFEKLKDSLQIDSNPVLMNYKLNEKLFSN